MDVGTHVWTHVCTYVCMDVYTQACTQVYTHLCMHVCVCDLCVYKHAYTFACVYICARVALYTCKHVYTWSVHTCVHICICVRAFCTHVYVYRSPSNSCYGYAKGLWAKSPFFWFGLFCLFFPKKEYRKFSINVIWLQLQKKIISFSVHKTKIPPEKATSEDHCEKSPTVSYTQENFM